MLILYLLMEVYLEQCVMVLGVSKTSSGINARLIGISTAVAKC